MAWILPIERYPGEPTIPGTSDDAVLFVSMLLVFCFFVSVSGVVLALRSGAWLCSLFVLLSALAIARAIVVFPHFQG